MLLSIALLVLVIACAPVKPLKPTPITPTPAPAPLPPGPTPPAGCPGGSTCPSTWNCQGTTVWSSGGIQCCVGFCVAPPPECTNHGQCNDNDDCTADRCISNTCVNSPISPCCGNGAAEAGENCANCPADAGCAPGEQCLNGVCAKCGDGTVQPGENCDNCPADAACPPGKYCVNAQCMDCRADNDCTPGRHCCTIVAPAPGPFAGGAAAINKCLSCCIDDHCNDYDPCTTNKCSKNRCVYDSIPNCPPEKIGDEGAAGPVGDTGEPGPEGPMH